ncbi:hypothetical protein BCEN4_1320075 [Burkholderia cenocepacia]|nr:hypothetical protein BCEN4_1320075 [Burkholderia cenocepacia]
MTGHNGNHCCYIVNTKLLACLIDKDKEKQLHRREISMCAKGIGVVHYSIPLSGYRRG